MALRWKLYRANIPEVDISDRVRADTISVRANAEEGSVPLSTIVVDDPDGSIDIPGLFYTIDGYETEAPALDQRFYRGFVADRTVSRGESDKSYRTTDARQWAVQAADPNSLLSRRLLLGTDANRPVETDVARVQYLMTSPEMTTVGITNSTYIDTSGAIQMDACDYRGQTVQAVIDDAAQTSGKNYWVMPREDLGAAVYSLWYDFPGSTAYPSAITISNVASDVDGVTCFAAAFDTALNRDPSRVYSGVYMPYEGGAVYQQLASTSSNFQARDTTSSSYNVKTAGRASARAIRYLADIATEEDRITTAIIVPNAKVNALKEGHLVYARFSHLPGYETSTGCRVLNRTVTQVSEEFYRIEVELSPVDIPAAAPSCQARNNIFYTYTAAGTYSSLGLHFVADVGPGVGDPPSGLYHFTSTAVVSYGRSGGLQPSYSPLAGELGDWGNGGSVFAPCVGTQGGIDYCGGGAAFLVILRIIGPGTLTINTPAAGNPLSTCGASPTSTVVAKAYRNDLGLTLVDSDEQSPGTPLTLTIPDGYCNHWVQIQGFEGKWGFQSAEWVPL